jgi:hypothetical protein
MRRTEEDAMTRWIAAAWLIMAPAAWAAPLTLQTVDAHPEAGVTDPRADAAARQLASRGYGHFTVSSERTVDLDDGATAGVRIADGHVLRVRMLETTRGGSRVRVKLLRDGEVQVDTTMTVREGRPLLVRAGKHADADLFAVVSVP